MIRQVLIEPRESVFRLRAPVHRTETTNCFSVFTQGTKTNKGRDLSVQIHQKPLVTSRHAGHEPGLINYKLDFPSLKYPAEHCVVIHVVM